MALETALMHDQHLNEDKNLPDIQPVHKTICRRCGRALTNPISVARGIGRHNRRYPASRPWIVPYLRGSDSRIPSRVRRPDRRRRDCRVRGRRRVSLRL